MVKYVMRVRSDNFNGYMTQDAYNEWRLQLSTGDYHTHEHAIWPWDALTATEQDEVMTLVQLELQQQEQFFHCDRCS